MPRKLTDRQVMAAAALDRLGEATLPQLHEECPIGETPSTTLRVVEQLIAKAS